MLRVTHDVAVKADGRSSARRRVASATLALVALMAAGAAAVSQPVPTVAVNEQGGIYNVAATFIVTEAPSFAFAALTDYARIPRFMPEVRTSQVIERTDERTIVEQEAIARFMMFSKRVHLVLEVQEARGVIRFRDRCGKSFERYEGVWTIAERDGHTVVTYELAAKPSFEVPEFLLKRLLKRDASQMIERLRTEINARARGPAL